MSLPDALLLFLGLYFTTEFLYAICYRSQRLQNTDRVIITLLSFFNLAVSLSPLPAVFFLGLEYEDAYIWIANALFLDKYQGFGRESFITNACLFGSVDRCIYSGSFSSHTILFPTILWGVSKITGFSPYIVSWTNLFFSILLIGRVYKLSLLLIRNRIYAFVTVLILVTAPIISVYHTTGFVETFSSYILVSCLYYYLAYDQTVSKKWPHLTLFIVSFLIAVFTKRENLLLILIPFIGLLERIAQGRRHQLGRLFTEAVALTGIIIIYFATAGTLLTEASEMADIGGPTFSLGYVLRLAPSLIGAVWSFDWFSLCSALICVGFLVATFWSPRFPMLLYPAMLSLSYLMLYLLHYRSYYFVAFGDVTSMEWLRYLTNVYPILCLMGGYTLLMLSQIRPTENWLVPMMALVLVAVQVRQAPELQRHFYEEELESRITPVTKTLELIGHNGDLIITAEPLLFQMFGNRHLELLDVYSIKPEMNDFLIEYDKIYFVRRKNFDSYADRTRFPNYKTVLDAFEARKIRELGREQELYELKMKVSAH